MEDEFLDVGFLSPDEANKLFEEGELVDETKQEKEEKEEEKETPQNKETNEVTEEGDTDHPESVGNKEIQGEKDTTEKSGSPNTSSFAKAFQEIGVLQTLDDNRLSSIKTPEDLADALEEEVANRLEAHTKRVDEALRYEMPVPLVKQYEDTLSTLEKVTDDLLEGEEKENGNYRKNLIFQDLINKGHSKDEAMEILQDYIDTGKDIDKAKKALESCKSFYTNKYKEAKESYKKAKEEKDASTKKQAEELKKSILEDDKLFKDLDINKVTRQEIYDTVSKPIETEEDGTKITKFQKYIKENPNDFYKMAGMFFVLTDGFTKIDNLIKGPVKKETRKGIDKLRNVINSTSRNDDGSLNLRTGVTPEDSMNLDLGNFKLA